MKPAAPVIRALGMNLLRGGGWGRELRATERREEPRVSPGTIGDRIVAFGARTAGIPVGGAQLLIECVVEECAAEHAGVAGWNQPTGHPVLHQFLDAPAPARDHRPCR